MGFEILTSSARPPVSPKLPPWFLCYPRGNGYILSFTIPQRFSINHHPRKRDVRYMVLEQFSPMYLAIIGCPLLDPRPLVVLRMVD